MRNWLFAGFATSKVVRSPVIRGVALEEITVAGTGEVQLGAPALQARRRIVLNLDPAKNLGIVFPAQLLVEVQGTAPADKTHQDRRRIGIFRCIGSFFRL